METVSHIFFRRKIICLIAPTEAYGFASCISFQELLLAENTTSLVLAEQLTLDARRNSSRNETYDVGN
jgi:hypothetical protein